MNLSENDCIRPGPGGDGPTDNPRSGAVFQAAKKKYVTPAFEYEQAFETMALACGKINPTQAQCKFNRKAS